MCIAAWIWQAHPVYPLLLVLNRDEFHDRYLLVISRSLLLMHSKLIKLINFLTCVYTTIFGGVRPTKAAGWWGEEYEKILGGRDVLGGGTWMGCTKHGRLAFLTNVLEPDSDPSAKTRGDLPLRFLQVS